MTSFKGASLPEFWKIYTWIYPIDCLLEYAKEKKNISIYVDIGQGGLAEWLENRGGPQR